MRTERGSNEYSTAESRNMALLCGEDDILTLLGGVLYNVYYYIHVLKYILHILHKYILYLLFSNTNRAACMHDA